MISSAHRVSGRPRLRLASYLESKVGSQSKALNVHLSIVSVETRRAHLHFRRRCVETQFSMSSFTNRSSASCVHLRILSTQGSRWSSLLGALLRCECGDWSCCSWGCVLIVPACAASGCCRCGCVVVDPACAPGGRCSCRRGLPKIILSI